MLQIFLASVHAVHRNCSAMNANIRIESSHFPFVANPSRIRNFRRLQIVHFCNCFVLGKKNAGNGRCAASIPCTSKDYPILFASHRTAPACVLKVLLLLNVTAVNVPSLFLVIPRESDSPLPRSIWIVLDMRNNYGQKLNTSTQFQIIFTILNFRDLVGLFCFEALSDS